MTVIGTEQRVYGTLITKCLIDLRRFAFIYGTVSGSQPYVYGPAIYPPPGQIFNNRFPEPGDSITFTTSISGHTTLNPPIARLEGNRTIEAGLTYIKTEYNILYAENGIIASNSNTEENQYYDDISVCVTKFRIKSNRIYVDVHGSVAPYVNISMWFNDAICDSENARWTKIGYANHNTIMPSQSFEFQLKNYDKSLADLTWCNGNIYVCIEDSSMINNVNNEFNPKIVLSTKTKR